MRLFWLMTTLVVCAAAASLSKQPTANKSGKIRYDNYQVYKINIRNEMQLVIMEFFRSKSEKYNVWKGYDEATKEIHVMVKPEEISNFLRLLKFNKFESKLMIKNVQELLDEEANASKLKADNGKFGWTRYYELFEIEQWLDGILATYSNITEGFVIGKSYENRDIRGIKISFKAGNHGIFIESNIHAREWITSATATWFINQLLTSTNQDVRNLAENYDWYIIPVFNVDGFVYSHQKHQGEAYNQLFPVGNHLFHNYRILDFFCTKEDGDSVFTDRMWRKTRQPVDGNKCIGTDANRNFDSHWMENGGASSNPCDETFAGPKAFSEPEVAALAEFVTSIKDKIKIYLSFHSYGQYLLSPYGHTKEEFPDNYDHLNEVGKSFHDAISSLTYKTEYRYGSTASVLYVASGSTIDWVYNKLGVKLSYTIEYRDKGRYGFVLPPVQILPNCEELMVGMIALVAKAKELNYV